MPFMPHDTMTERDRLVAELDAARKAQSATAGILRTISSSGFDLGEVLRQLARVAGELCGADETIIFLRAGDEYHAHATHGADPRLLEFLKAHPRRRGQKSLVPRVIESGRTEHIPDKLLDKEFAFQGASAFSDTRAMLGVPMLRDGVIEGVFSLSRYAPGPFSDTQIALLHTFADQAVIAIENARLFAELEARNREVLSRYFSPKLAARLASDREGTALKVQRQEVGVLFSDVAGFTTLTESIAPDELAEILNSYLDGMTRVIFAHEGTIAKVIGDALYVLFGAPDEQPDLAERSVACALDMDDFAEDFRRRWNERGVAFGETRIGINAGPAVVGSFGGGPFFDYTAYGDTINIAARLETANKQFGTRICVSANVTDRIASFRGRPIGNLLLRGRATRLRAFEPLRQEAFERPQTASYLAAFAKLEARDPGALGAFAALVGADPDDRLASAHLRRLLNGATGADIDMN